MNKSNKSKSIQIISEKTKNKGAFLDLNKIKGGNNSATTFIVEDYIDGA
ncbi:MAG: hypothetical protein ACI8ZM_001322 [Crocinitomix sp.]|jgi:hypothetical protein